MDGSETTVKTFSYDDRGMVEAETVINTGERRFIIVENSIDDEHKVYESEPDKKEPFMQRSPEQRYL